MVTRNLADNLNYAFDETVLLDFRDDLSQQFLLQFSMNFSNMEITLVRVKKNAKETITFWLTMGNQV